MKIEALLDGIAAYIADADPPIVAEYAHANGITRQYLYELAATAKKRGDPRLSDAIKMLSEAKEIALERGGLSGHFSPSMAIFSLKQLGWTDKGPQDAPVEDSPYDDALTAALRAEAERMENGKNA